MKITNELRTGRGAGLFAVIAFIGGFFFLNQGITGNAVLLEEKISLFNPVSFIGLILIFCSAILVIYAVRRK